MISNDSVPLISDDKLDSIYQYEAAFYLFDTRTREEFNVSHLPGAVWIGEKDSLPQGINDSLPIVVYCSIGYRSGKAGERMLKAGFAEVYNLDGGIFHWVNAGKSIVNSKGVVTDSVHGYSPAWGSWIKEGTVVYE
ncbi:MAG: rhodanese-like domain-containing protein [Cyclobacteriaceae bacterium]